MGRKKKSDKMRVVSVKMEPSLIVSLDRTSRQVSLTRSSMIRAALIAYVEKVREARER